jgi:hypothetical protein
MAGKSGDFDCAKDLLKQFAVMFFYFTMLVGFSLLAGGRGLPTLVMQADVYQAVGWL